MKETKEMKFYGFNFTEGSVWKDITEDELEILRNLNRPIKREYEAHSYESRGNKNVSDWIYSRLWLGAIYWYKVYYLYKKHY